MASSGRPNGEGLPRSSTAGVASGLLLGSLVAAPGTHELGKAVHDLLHQLIDDKNWRVRHAVMCLWPR